VDPIDDRPGNGTTRSASNRNRIVRGPHPGFNRDQRVPMNRASTKQHERDPDEIPTDPDDVPTMSRRAKRYQS